MKPHTDTAELFATAAHPEMAECLHGTYGATIHRAGMIASGQQIPKTADERLGAIHDIQGMLEWVEAEKALLSMALAMLQRSPGLEVVVSGQAYPAGGTSGGMSKNWKPKTIARQSILSVVRSHSDLRFPPFGRPSLSMCCWVGTAQQAQRTFS